MKYLALLLVASLAGAAASNPGPRRLTFAYAEYPTAKIKGPVTHFSGPGTGTLDVTIAGRAPDGGLVVQARDWWWNAVRPRQTASCELYRNGDFACERYPLLSQGQLAILPLLAENFFQSTAQRWEVKRWMRQSYFCGYYSATSTTVYSVTGTSSNGDVNLDGSGTYRIPCLHEPTIHDRTSMTYDPNTFLPVRVHDETTGTLDSVLTGHSVDLELVKDSYHS